MLYLFHVLFSSYCSKHLVRRAEVKLRCMSYLEPRYVTTREMVYNCRKYSRNMQKREAGCPQKIALTQCLTAPVVFWRGARSTPTCWHGGLWHEVCFVGGGTSVAPDENGCVTSFMSSKTCETTVKTAVQKTLPRNRWYTVLDGPAFCTYICSRSRQVAAVGKSGNTMLFVL